MTTLRSSLPSRLRQLLSGDGSFGPSVKLETEPVSLLSCSINSSSEKCLCFLCVLWVCMWTVYMHLSM